MIIQFGIRNAFHQDKQLKGKYNQCVAVLFLVRAMVFELLEMPGSITMSYFR
jgi:hypothetical protein